MGLPTRRAKRHLPCGHSEEEMVYLGHSMVCRKDGRKWEWVPAQWREIVAKPKKGAEEEESAPEKSAAEKSLFSKVFGKKEAVPAQ